MKSHPILDTHLIIAWDIDETLINGPNSIRFAQYIRNNPDREHHIVTFRSAEEVVGLEEELAEYGIDIACFSTITHYPEEIDWTEEPDNYWKGSVASKMGATVLVDDLAHLVIPGCELHEIEFVHAYEPIEVE